MAETVCLLLKSARDQTDRVVSVLASRCLGRIGAVDPGRLHGGGSVDDDDVSADDDPTVLMASPSLDAGDDDILTGDDKFGLNLLKVLIKSVLGTTDTFEYESCSFTIQVHHHYTFRR